MYSEWRSEIVISCSVAWGFGFGVEQSLDGMVCSSCEQHPTTQHDTNAEKLQYDPFAESDKHELSGMQLPSKTNDNSILDLL